MHFLANFLSPRSDELKQSFGQNNLKTGFALPRQFFSGCPISDFDSTNIIFFPIFVSLDYDLIMTHVFQLFLAVLTFLFLFSSWFAR